MLKNLNRGISIPVAIGIIAILVIVVGGGILAYQYYYTIEKEQLNLQRPIAETPEIKNVEPYIKVLSPNGGEQWKIGETYNIKWDSTGVSKIYVTLFNYGQTDSCRLTYESIINTGSYSFAIGQQGRCPQSVFIGDKIKIQVSADVNTTNGVEIKDESDNYFSIVDSKPYIKVLSPNGGEVWKIGNDYKIKWDSRGVSQIKIDIVDYRAPESCMLNNRNPIPAYPGEYSFKLESCVTHNVGVDEKVNLSPGSEYKVRIEDAGQPEKTSDFSDNYFSIEK
jgi:hypothetical protein